MSAIGLNLINSGKMDVNAKMSKHEIANPSTQACTLRVAAWFCLTLLIIDLGINIVFAYPQNPAIANPPQFQAYFEYGRSMEGQLARMTRPYRAETAPITLAGWYDPLQVSDYPARLPQNPIVTIYGASHAVNLANALSRVSERFTPRAVGAPGATGNWAFGAYLRDLGGGKSHAAVLELQSSNLPMIVSLSPMMWSIGSAMPYTAYRFVLDGERFGVIHPPYTSFEGYVDAFGDARKWAAMREFFAKNDPLYNALIFRETVFDHSVLFRLSHRAYANSVMRSIRRAAIDQTGFHPQSEPIRIARRIIQEFAINAREHGIIPVLFLVNDLGYSDHLFQALNPAILADNVPCLSSHLIIPPNDPRGYLPDSRFTIEGDNKLARALEDIVRAGDVRVR
jgi:hypothetical protein